MLKLPAQLILSSEPNSKYPSFWDMHLLVQHDCRKKVIHSHEADELMDLFNSIHALAGVDPMAYEGYDPSAMERGQVIYQFGRKWGWWDKDVILGGYPKTYQEYLAIMRASLQRATGTAMSPKMADFLASSHSERVARIVGKFSSRVGALMNLVRDLTGSQLPSGEDRKIWRIKMLREAMNLDLMEAKTLCEEMIEPVVEQMIVQGK